MALGYTQNGVDEIIQLGKNGIKIDGSSKTKVIIKDSSGSLVPMQGGDAQISSDFVTKGQMDAATGNERGSIVIEYSSGNEPVVTGFTQNQIKEFDLTSGSASVVSKYHQVPPSTQTFNGSDDRTYIIDTSNGLLLPNNVDKQSHVFSIRLYYDQKGGFNDEDIGVVFHLVEFDGTNEQDTIYKEQGCMAGNSRTGFIDVDFNCVASVDTRGTGKGWRLKIMSKEGDSNFRFKIKRIARYCF